MQVVVRVVVVVVFEFLCPYWQVLNLKTGTQKYKFQDKLQEIAFYTSRSWLLVVCLFAYYYAPLFYIPGFEISFILQLRKGFWETFTEWEEEEEKLDPEEEDKRRRKEMEEEGIALMGRLYKMMMMMNINKYDGKISTYDGQVVQKDDDGHQQI